MKRGWKNPIIWSGLLAIIVVLGLGLTKHNQTTEPQQSIDNQLGACQKAARAYVGLTEAQASSKAESENRAHRVVERDGVGLGVTQDYGPGRLNFVINNGSVEEVTCG